MSMGSPAPLALRPLPDQAVCQGIFLFSLAIDDRTTKKAPVITFLPQRLRHCVGKKLYTKKFIFKIL